MNQKQALTEQETVELRSVIQAVVSDLSDLNKPKRTCPKWVIIGRDKGLEVGEWQY